MPLAEKYNFLKRGKVVEVRAEALEDKYLRKGGDGVSEVQGYEGTWRRATVVDHTKKEKTDKRRWVIIRLQESQAMYGKWKPLGKDKEPPLPFDRSENGNQTSDSGSDEDSAPEAIVPAEFFAAPIDLRPWVPFSDSSVWPQVSAEQLKGPEPGRPPWAEENHHVACCYRSSPCWKATFGKDRPLFPLEDHLRHDQVYDLESGQWARQDRRAYFDPEWEVGGRISGQCPHVRRADQLLGDEVHKARMHAAMAAVGSAIADGPLPEDLQAFARSFDVKACITAAASEEDAQELAEMLQEPLFHDTFCGFLLDSLRQESPVTCTGIAVFEQIKVTFKRDAAALHKHMACEFIRAHFL